MPTRDDDDAGLDEREDPEPDADDDDSPDTVPCPYCGKQVYEEAEFCPHCESYISREDAPPRVPWWLAAGVVVCLLIVVSWILAT